MPTIGSFTVIQLIPLFLSIILMLWAIGVFWPTNIKKRDKQDKE